MCKLTQLFGSHEIFYSPKTSVGNRKSNIEEVTLHIEPRALQVECSLVLWRRLGHLLCHYHPWLLYDDNVSLNTKKMKKTIKLIKKRIELLLSAFIEIHRRIMCFFYKATEG